MRTTKAIKADIRGQNPSGPRAVAYIAGEIVHNQALILEVLLDIRQQNKGGSTMTNREEVIAVRQALSEASIPFVSVKHGKGTMWDWLEINEGPQDRSAEECTESRLDIIKLAQKVTGRRGDYDGKITVSAQ